jgi:hypothetical protein
VAIIVAKSKNSRHIFKKNLDLTALKPRAISRPTQLNSQYNIKI